MSLTEDDLAYMREVQAEHRPTPAELFARTVTRMPSGGEVTGYSSEGQPVMARIDGAPDRVPQVIADRLEGAAPVKITLDAGLPVRALDQLRVSTTEAYVVVTEGDPDRWATAQVLWARRTLWPAR